MRVESRQQETVRYIPESDFPRYRRAADILRLINQDDDYIDILTSRHRPDGTSTVEGHLSLTITGDILRVDPSAQPLQYMVDALTGAERVGYATAEADLAALTAEEGTSPAHYKPEHRLGDE